MPEEISPAFGHEALEADMERLAAEVRRRAEWPEMKGVSDKEILRQSLKVFGAPDAAPSSPPAAQEAVPNYAGSASAEAKLEIEYLIDVAFHQGLAKATAEAAKSNPFILDAFHDVLAGKLYPVFKERGILK